MDAAHRVDGFFGSLLFEWRGGALFATEREYAAHQCIGAHVHERPYVCIVTRGGYRERTMRAALDCRRGTVLLHPAGTRHSDEFVASPSRCLMIEMDRDFDEPLVATTGPLVDLGSRIESELRVRDDLTHLALEGLLLETAAAATRARTVGVPPWLRRAMEIVRDEPMRTHTLRGLAGAAGVHPAHLARAFRRGAGCTLGEYVRRMRVERAKEAIAAGRALVDVAADCGFADQSHLTRTFRRVVGMTPAAYRRAQT